ncbi:hypothetical protein PMI41_03932 [Phyllobacterium sp. YR531]|nr:hypothetical protein PMI41_03932 [Phyllobacterium sp. YR531]
MGVKLVGIEVNSLNSFRLAPCLAEIIHLIKPISFNNLHSHKMLAVNLDTPFRAYHQIRHSLFASP